MNLKKEDLEKMSREEFEKAFVELANYRKEAHVINNRYNQMLRMIDAGQLPYYIPYANINSMGKQWIRKYALSVAKEMLAQVRGKIGSIPIPGSDVTLNASDLASQAKEEQTTLKEELKTLLDQLTYDILMEKDTKMVEESGRLQSQVPMTIFVG